MKTSYTVILLVLFGGFVGYALYIASQPKTSDHTQIRFCNRDTKQCPDGSTVRRIGSDCNFAECSATTTVQTLEYRNTNYGFFVPLPESWRGYTVNEQVKDGYKQINIVHPLSTKENPRMDVPIIVVPIATWNTWYPPGHEQDGQHPFAAPVPATERARNNTYVFATAPRYNFSYLPGFEEVDLIVQQVKAFNL